jgi:hypothetical protein
MKVNLKTQICSILLLFFATNTFSQTVYKTVEGTKSKTKPTYLQFEVAVAIVGNENAHRIDPNTKQKEFWLKPDGVISKIGYGIHYNQWATIGLHSGIEWKFSDKLVAIPVFVNMSLAPKIGEESRLYFQFGYGKSIALGRGALLGNYKRASLGFSPNEDFLIFIELSQHDLMFDNNLNVGSVSFGIAKILF